MGLETRVKIPTNGFKESAYIRKYEMFLRHSAGNDIGSVEFEVYETKNDKDNGSERLGRLIHIDIGKDEFTEKPVDEKNADYLRQIAYSDIKPEIDALWAKVYGILKKKSIDYSGVICDLSKAVDC